MHSNPVTREALSFKMIVDSSVSSGPASVQALAAAIVAAGRSGEADALALAKTLLSSVAPSGAGAGDTSSDDGRSDSSGVQALETAIRAESVRISLKSQGRPLAEAMASSVLSPELADQILKASGTTGVRQVWFTRNEAKTAVKAAYAAGLGHCLGGAPDTSDLAAEHAVANYKANVLGS